VNTISVIGGGVAAAGAATVVGGLIYRNGVQNEAARLPQYTRDVATRTSALDQARETLRLSIPEAPGNIDAEQAFELADKRFGSGYLIHASTGQDSADVGVSEVIDNATHSPTEAASIARNEAGGRATAVVQVGDWYVPVVLDNALAPRQHSRQVMYHDTEYNYHYGYNPMNNEYEYHYGPESVTRFRTEEYLSQFNQYTPDRYGVAQASNGEGDVMRNLGTGEQQAVARSEQDLQNAQDHVSSAEHALAHADTAGNAAFIAGGILAAGGTATIGYSLLAAAARR
jgi:hypothetical protein